MEKWKCSECGNLYFEEVQEEVKQLTLNSEGLVESIDCEYQRHFLRCTVCLNSGSEIFDIADLLEE